MTSTTKRFTTIQVCLNCDSTASSYNEEDIRVCSICHVEWYMEERRVEIDFCHLHQETLLDGEACFTCEDHAETARMMMHDLMVDEIEAIERGE